MPTSPACLAWCERHAIDPDVLDRIRVLERNGYLVIPNGRALSLQSESLSPRAVVGVGLTVESVEGRESGQDEKKRGELFFHLCLPGRIDWKQLCARRELVLRRQVRFSG